jgi:hypothetical protein
MDRPARQRQIDRLEGQTGRKKPSYFGAQPSGSGYFGANRTKSGYFGAK